MNAKQQMMINDLLFAESDLGNPSFEWSGSNYPCIPSSPNTQWILGEGGYEETSNLSMTVRIFNKDGSFVFPNNVLPPKKDMITVYGQEFRIEQANPNVIGACFEIVASNPFKGV